MSTEFWKKACAVGVATAALAVAGGSGAVAAQLLTGEDIKDRSIESVDLATDAVTTRTIDAGAVGWNKLNPSTREWIAEVAGVPGPQGEAGEQGVRGPQGERGLPGTNGGSVAGYNIYSSLEGMPQLEGAGEDIVLTEAGTYMVTINGIALGPVALYAGGPAGLEGIEESFLRACFGSQPVFELGLPFASCKTTYPLEVTEAELPLTLQVDVLPLLGGGEEPDLAPAFAEVTVLSVGGALPDVDVCAEDCEGPTRAAERRALQQLERLADRR